MRIDLMDHFAPNVEVYKYVPRLPHSWPSLQHRGGPGYAVYFTSSFADGKMKQVFNLRLYSTSS